MRMVCVVKVIIEGSPNLSDDRVLKNKDTVDVQGGRTVPHHVVFLLDVHEPGTGLKELDEVEAQ